MNLSEEVAHQMGAVPLLWVAWRHQRGTTFHAGYWWLAVAFSVSWLADWAGHVDRWRYGWTVAALYPIAQTAIVGDVLLPNRRHALLLTLALIAVAVLDVFVWGTDGPDLLLATFAGYMVVRTVWPMWALGRLRTALLIYFGLGTVALWLWQVLPMWYVYQAIRAIGIGWFCWACVRPEPSLRLEPAT